MRIEILFGTIFILCFLLCCIAQFPEMRTCPICDDSNPCTLDKCVNFSCIYEPLTGNVSGCYEEHGNCSFSTCEAGKCITKIVEKCCGNGVCEEGENCLTCKEDCWACTNISEYLVPPIVPSYLPREVPPEPEVNSRVPILISLKFEITTYGIFEKYGGVIGIKAISDTNTFLKNVKVIANYTKQAELQGAWSIKASGSLDLGLLHITGPERSGIYSFKICADTIATRNNLSYLFENLCTNPVNIYVLELPNLTNYSIIFDPLISGQIRPYLDFSEGMGELIKNATSAFPGDYNIYQVAYIFDWVRKNVNYTRTYYWMNASEIFSKKYGDCKHFSILLSSFIMELGGAARIFMTKEHMFTSFYAGNRSSFEQIVEGIRKYYGDLVPVYYVEDKYGFWIILDGTCSNYVGGLPCDAVPYEDNLWFVNLENLKYTEIFWRSR